jgi:hypothetical protein
MFIIGLCMVPYIAHSGQVCTILPEQIAVIAPLDHSESPRLIVRFDVSEIDEDRRIDFAQLLFKGHLDCENLATEVARIEAFPVLTEWQPGSVSWDTPWESDGGDFDTSRRKSNWIAVGDSAAMWLDVTEILRGWRDEIIPNEGIIVKTSDVVDTALDEVNSGRVVLKVWHHADYRR